MEPEDSLPCSQGSAIEPHISSPQIYNLLT